MAPPPATLVGARAIKTRLLKEAREQARASGEEHDATDELLEAIIQSVSQQSTNSAVDCDASGEYITRPKTRTKEHRQEMEDAADAMNARGIRTKLPRFSATHLETFEALHDEFVEYCAHNNVAYRLRHSLKSPARNLKQELAHDVKVQKAKAEYALQLRQVIAGERARGKGDGALVQDDEEAAKRKEAEYVDAHVPPFRPIPDHLTYFQKMCVHAEYQEDRSTGIRNQITTIYIKCPARITMEAVYDSSENKHKIVTRMENGLHNHLCTDDIFLAYLNSSRIEDEELFERVISQVAAGGNPRLIRDQLSTDYNIDFTRTMFSNLKQYHLGGGLATLNLELLIELLQSFDGTRCVMVTDQADIVCGIIFQTRMQRALFEQFGDVLVMDWTHNTNNLGFYLGSLVATSATGKGIPVLEFLCLSQGKAMMITVLEYFVENNPLAAEKVKTFVIDKDVKEKGAINKVLPKAAVVLCQFHVISCFKTVMTSGEYKIDLPLRARALVSLKGMIYSDFHDDFKHHKASLRAHLCGDARCIPRIHEAQLVQHQGAVGELQTRASIQQHHDKHDRIPLEAVQGWPWQEPSDGLLLRGCASEGHCNSPSREVRVCSVRVYDLPPSWCSSVRATAAARVERTSREDSGTAVS